MMGGSRDADARLQAVIPGLDHATPWLMTTPKSPLARKGDLLIGARDDELGSTKRGGCTR